MKHILLVFLLIITGFCLKGQTTSETKEGVISYVTKQNIYVKFLSTEDISVGDTLFIPGQAKLIPVLIVKELSSISCVCMPIAQSNLAVADKVLTRQKLIQQKKTNEISPEPKISPVEIKRDTVAVKKDLPKKLKQDVNGRIAIASYSNFSNGGDPSHRMRYTFSLNAQNISDSKLSAETYISFVHKINEWSEVKADVFNALKIYSLAINYAFDKNNVISLGRKINPKLSSVGAIDGIQYETKLRSLTMGLIAGTRPDYMNYGFNSRLLQYGGYLGHDFTTKTGNMQSSVAVVEQKNNGNTDRRFAYLQHTNSLITNLYFFGSLEFDLFNYKKVAINQGDTLTKKDTLQKDNAPKLSNLYVSLRYKVFKNLSLSLSYSARQNIIYYETYKTIVERLLEQATLQGYMLQVNYRPAKNISLGANAGYRFSKPDPRPSKNLYSYLTFNRVPGVNASATISATLLETSYMSGNIYSLGISRDLIRGRLDGGINYRYVKYKFRSSEKPLVQNIGELNLTWRMMKKLSCSFNFEGTFEKGKSYDRIYINLTQRF